MENPLTRPPVIGICAPLEHARWAVWDMPAALVAANYLEAIWAAGGRSLLIAPDPALIEDPDSVLACVDGVLLVGGADIAASRYGAESHVESEMSQPVRDAVEIALVLAATTRGLPVLGICRGLQIINVAYGGTLRQHLPDELAATTHRRVTGQFAGNQHDVIVAPNSLAAQAIGSTAHEVVSHHHQAVDRLGEGLLMTGWSDDGVVEAIEAPDGYLLGVQWHPEADATSGVIAHLVEASRRLILENENKQQCPRSTRGHTKI
jgi:putative glutamine amidotransferase